MTKNEVMQMALDVLKYVDLVSITAEEYKEVEQAVEALRTALAQPEPEPFGIWHQGDTDEESDFFLYKDAGDVACETCVKLYAEPKRREWVWLTISEVVDCYGNGTAAELGVAHRIQAMSKEKNHG